MVRDPYKKVSLCTACIMLLGVACLSAQVVAIMEVQESCGAHEIVMYVDPADEVPASPTRVSDTTYIIDSFVEAIVQIESAGDPGEIGTSGERGLMQIKRATWNSVTKRMYGEPLPFSQAFDPALNRRVGRAYLMELKQFLRQHRDEWQVDERSLLLACYNAGPTRVMNTGFDLATLPSLTRSYVERACALHDDYVSEHQAMAVMTAQLAAGDETSGVL